MSSKITAKKFKRGLFMIIMGIDQGLAHLGYSILEYVPKKTKRDGFVKVEDNVYVKVIESGCFLTAPNDLDFSRRLFKLMNKVETKILEYEPDFVCCEALFFSVPAKGSRNKSSSIMTTNMVTGVIAYICGKLNIKFNTYSPTCVKKRLCNSGEEFSLLSGLLRTVYAI